MHRAVRETAVLAVAGLIFVTAAYHLWWGLPRSILYAQALGFLLVQNLPPDPRPFLFVGYGIILFAGPMLVTREYLSARRAYAAGAVLMVLAILGWLAWHASGHGAPLHGDAVGPVVGDDGHSHGQLGLVSLVLEHYVTEPIEGVIKSVELVAGVLFAWLWYTEE
jgi:hypothetical protein